MVVFPTLAALRVASRVGDAVVATLAVVVTAAVVGLSVRGFVLAVIRGGLVIVVLVLTSLGSAGHFRDAVAVCC